MRCGERATTVLAAIALAVGLMPVTGAMASVLPMSQRLQALTDAVAAASPTDDQLAGKSDADLVTTAVRCSALDGRTYCLHLGWVDKAPSAQHLHDIVGAQEAQEAAGTRADSNGDMPLAAQIRAWARQPRTVRVARERTELDQARQALGKVRLYDYLNAGQQVPQGFWQDYPETADWGKALTAKSVDGPPTDIATVGLPDRGIKQPNGFYCGPSSFVALAWNDRIRGDELSPHGFATADFWAMRLGTTSDGTAITSIAANINEHLTWKNWVGQYVVVGIGGWDVARWQSLWRNHIPGGPVQLHPVLNPSNNSYGMSTSGHFNVGRGYDFTPGQATWYIALYEPAGGSRVPVSYWETHGNVINANRNHPMRNIAY